MDTTYVTLDSSEISVCGNSVIVDVSVNNLSEVSSGQFSLKWNSSVLKFDSLIALNRNSSFNVSQPGELDVLFINLPSFESSTYELMFEIVGNIGDSTLIEFNENGLETLFWDEDKRITPFQFSNSLVKIEASDPLNISLTTTPPSTSNSNDGQIEITNIGGGGNSGNYEFSWSNGAATQLLDSLEAGIYTVTITEGATGCMIDTTIVLSLSLIHI